ncbi:MAG: MFS transporter [Bacillota bacterium]
MDNLADAHELKKIPLLDKIGYGMGNFSSGVAIQIIGAYLVFYATAILDIPGTLVGIAVSLSIVWDAVTDPLMGYISDETRSRIFGRRHLYLLIGCLGMAVSNYVLWHIDLSLSMYTKYLIILIDILFAKSFMTIYMTPYTALGAELSFDYNERTSIQGIKTIFFLLGLSFVSVAGMYIFFKPTAQYEVGQLNPMAYRSMGLFSSIVIVIFALICFFSTKKYIPVLYKETSSQQRSSVADLFSQFKKTLKNGPFKSVAFSYMFNNIASALMSNIGLHVFTYTFMLDNQDIAYIIGIQFMVSILSQPIWTLISRRLDKKPAMLLGLLISIVGCLIFFILVLLKDTVTGSFLYFIPFSVSIGFGMGGLFTLPLSMAADTIDLDELNTGTRSEGMYYGCLTLFYKMSQSITIFLIGFILDIIKFDCNLPVQTDFTALSLGLIVSLGATVSFIFSYLYLKKYPLNKESVIDIQYQILHRP